MFDLYSLLYFWKINKRKRQLQCHIGFSCVYRGIRMNMIGQKDISDEPTTIKVHNTVSPKIVNPTLTYQCDIATNRRIAAHTSQKRHGLDIYGWPMGVFPTFSQNSKLLKFLSINKDVSEYWELCKHLTNKQLQKTVPCGKKHKIPWWKKSSCGCGSGLTWR